LSAIAGGETQSSLRLIVHAVLLLLSPFAGHGITHIFFDLFSLAVQLVETVAHEVGNAFHWSRWQNLHVGAATAVTREKSSGPMTPEKRSWLARGALRNKILESLRVGIFDLGNHLEKNGVTAGFYVNHVAIGLF